MSAKTRRPTPTERVVRVKDLFPVLKAINLMKEQVEMLKVRVAEMEASQPNESPLCARGTPCPLCGTTLGDEAHFCSTENALSKAGE